jgi:hypothetical protein
LWPTVSRRAEGKRSEEARRRQASGGDGPARLRMQLSVKTCQWVAPQQGEERGTKKRSQGHLDASESRADGGGRNELR